MVRYKNTNVVFPPVLTYIVHVDIVHDCIVHAYIVHAYIYSTQLYNTHLYRTRFKVQVTHLKQLHIEFLMLLYIPHEQSTSSIEASTAQSMFML